MFKVSSTDLYVCLFWQEQVISLILGQETPQLDGTLHLFYTVTDRLVYKLGSDRETGLRACSMDRDTLLLLYCITAESHGEVVKNMV